MLNPVMTSFVPVLQDWLRKTSAKRVWEWGPGLSTHVILSDAPSLQSLTSVEHQAVWAEKIRGEVSDPRWTLLEKNVARRVSDYATCLLKESQPFDLIFVDGRRRVECCFAAMLRLAPDGVIVLHDASRKAYTDLLDPHIAILDFRRDTLVFRPSAYLTSGN
jgi:predicted O-methyltransferase YrrM